MRLQFHARPPCFLRVPPQSGSDMDSVSYGVGPQATMARASQYARHFQQMGSNHLGAVATAEDVYGDDDGDEYVSRRSLLPAAFAAGAPCFSLR